MGKAINRTGSGPMKDKRTKRNRDKSTQKRNAITESRADRDVQTRTTRPTEENPFKGKKTDAIQWNRWTP